MPLDAARPNRSLNVLGGALETCSLDPMTGFTRTGCCETGRRTGAATPFARR